MSGKYDENLEQFNDPKLNNKNEMLKRRLFRDCHCTSPPTASQISTWPHIGVTEFVYSIRSCHIDIQRDLINPLMVSSYHMYQ